MRDRPYNLPGWMFLPPFRPAARRRAIRLRDWWTALAETNEALGLHHLAKDERAVADRWQHRLEILGGDNG